MKKLIILALILSLGMGCTSESNLKRESYKTSNESNATSSTASMSYEIEDDIETMPQDSRIDEKVEDSNIEKGSKIIKEGNMRIQVEDLTDAKSSIDSLVSKNKGYYEKELLRNSEYNQNYSLKIRVPSAYFSALVGGLEQGRGLILEKSINAKDVTEEYLDLEIRQENNTAYLNRYKELLKKAKSIKDMIEIQERIRRIELLIDSSKGRIKYLNDKANYSTLTIDLITKPKEYIAQVPSFFEKIIKAFKNGFSGVLNFILFLTNIWPILFVLLVIWLGRKKLTFNFRKKKTL